MTQAPTPRKPFHVLLVCTANQCRSPIAEALLKRSADKIGLRWSVRSAGTEVLAGAELIPEARDVLTEAGVTVGAHRARPLTAAAIVAADLILTAEVSHRHAVVALEPTALKKSFTLLQFARYSSIVTLESTNAANLGRDLVAGANVARSKFQPAKRHDEDIDDPIGKPLREFRVCRDIIDNALDKVIRPIVESPAMH